VLPALGQSAQQQVMLGQKITSGAFTPTDIAGLKVWLKADALVLSDGDPVTTWADSSGSGNDATEATFPPSYQTNELNSKPIVRFDSGTLTRLTTAAFSAELTQPTTHFIVVKSLADNNHFITDGISGTKRNTFYKKTGSFNNSIFAGTAEINNSNWGTASYFYASIYFDGASSELFKNGVSDASGNPGTNGLTGLTIGADFAVTIFGSLDCAEILIYDTRLSLANRQLVEGYLATKYGL